MILPALQLPSLSLYLLHVGARAEELALLMAVAMLIGEFFARGPFEYLLHQVRLLVLFLGRKLDRPKRSVATLVYRGIVAITLLLIPTVVIAILLSLPLPSLQFFSGILVTLWLGFSFSFWRTIALMNRAKADGLPLEIPKLHFLFADQHAVIRHLIGERMETFAVGMVGACFWYVLGGLPLMATYLVLASASTAYRGRLAFGWAARGAFVLMDAIPRCISAILLLLAGVFTPQTKPWKALRFQPWRSFIAHLLAISLGGPMPGAESPWVGTGTARVMPAHLRRALYLEVAGCLLLTLLLASQTIYKLLIKIH